ncbi:C40 family peptidase [Streptomyces fuscigenes]|uniref:C40 family peptidase n=1 Tax=Streptomyces fuscigenes TaxID=1528880 RepID=UPI001F261F87|nr:C40 family peptidase [Streptomyces fuscigenes]MCF3965259.1 NlpC/P60 family protein [Streptomyces fuscigenes]
MSRRRRVAAAIALVCALGLSVAPGWGTHRAYAAPKPPGGSPLPAQDYGSPVAPPPVELPPGTTRGSAPGGGSAVAQGATDTSLDAVRRHIDTLYQQAGSATDAYNLAAQRTSEQKARMAQTAQALVDSQTRIAALKEQAGAAARAQYRSGGLPPSAQLTLTGDPQAFVDGLSRATKEQKAANGLLQQLKDTQSDLTTYAQDASTNWKTLKKNQSTTARTTKQIKQKIADAKTLESGLEADQKARLAKLEQDAVATAQTAWLNSDAPTDMNRAPSAAGAQALAFATEQIGKPYVWGAEGPDSYDCSGLTSQAWAAAGLPIPRTSQEQWRLLPHISIADMRPGDLIIYYKDASHVAMYAGAGKIVQAPRPGRDVTLSEAGAMPILGVVRPDQ